MSDIKDDLLDEEEEESVTSAAEKVDPVEIDAGEAAIAPPRERTYSTGTKISAFVFFVITAVVFVFYAKFCLAHSSEILSGSVLMTLAVLLFLIGQVWENLIAIIQFKALLGASDKGWENALFLVFFLLSLLMVIAAVLGFGIAVAKLVLVIL